MASKTSKKRAKEDSYYLHNRDAVNRAIEKALKHVSVVDCDLCGLPIVEDRRGYVSDEVMAMMHNDTACATIQQMRMLEYDGWVMMPHDASSSDSPVYKPGVLQYFDERTRHPVHAYISGYGIMRCKSIADVVMDTFPCHTKRFLVKTGLMMCEYTAVSGDLNKYLNFIVQYVRGSVSELDISVDVYTKHIQDFKLMLADAHTD